MKHLTVDDMIRFVSLTELNDEAMELSASVNGHIRRCGECLERVRAFQMIYDEFTALSGNGDFRKRLDEYVELEAQKLPKPRLQLENCDYA
jgi:hypothetical protein